jgi:predicted enzyme related to lactoylglutathione lyase
MATTKILDVFPQFLVLDVESSLRYYRDVYGFQITNSTHEPPVFGIVRRDGVGLHLKRGIPQPRRTGEEGWNAYFQVRGVDQLCVDLLSNGAQVSRHPETKPYGMREFDTVDPDGYVLCFGEDVGASAA